MPCAMPIFCGNWLMPTNKKTRRGPNRWPSCCKRWFTPSIRTLVLAGIVDIRLYRAIPSLVERRRTRMSTARSAEDTRSAWPLQTQQIAKLVVVGKNLPHFIGKLLIFALFIAVFRRLTPRKHWCDVHHSTQYGHRIHLLLRLNKSVLYSASFAKKTVAFSPFAIVHFPCATESTRLDRLALNWFFHRRILARRFALCLYPASHGT